MHDKIKQLWEKAATASAAYPSGQNNSWETQVNFMEKFAELIVKECATLAFDGPNGILEHFGVEDTFKVGSRIKVISGFNVGAKGTVSYIEPTGRMWVRRDGASSDVFYHPEEVIGVE